MEITGTVSFDYEIVSQTYPAGGSMNQPLHFTASAPSGMRVVGGGFHYDQGSGIDYSRPATDGSAWEVGITGPTIHSLTVWAVCISSTSA